MYLAIMGYIILSYVLNIGILELLEDKGIIYRIFATILWLMSPISFPIIMLVLATYF